MKILMLIVCVLALIHADEATTGKVFRDYLAECEKELPKVPGLPKELNVGIIFCAVKRTEAIDKNNALNRNKIMTNCENMISDPVKVEQCQDICNTCMDEGFKVPGSNFIQTTRAIQCAVSYDVISLLDKE
ncbi:unnamed protein product [Lasius platythorax]|uniref:Ant venom allergen Sol i 2/4 domain-containing protein n=1 Tax=Lasius platythorax TaxID=488582 RepID=A0AAV2N3V4_9HYME